MKRLFTLSLLLALLCTGGLHAQVLRKSSTLPGVPLSQRRAAIEAGDGQLWWGYMSTSDNLRSIGRGQADTYHCALFLPGDHDVAGGKKLCAVSFALLASSATDVKVWTAAQLPTGAPTADNTLWLASVGKAEQGGYTDVALDTPYDIPAEGVYVGYSFTITSASTQNDQYPVIVASGDDANGFFIRLEQAAPEWDNLATEGFGVLNMHVLLEGDFAQHSVSAAPQLESYYAQAGQQAEVGIVLTNNGLKPVSSVSYTLDEGTTEQTVTLAKPIATFGQGVIAVSVDADAQASQAPRRVTITRVNGQPNESAGATAAFTLFTLDRLIARRVVVEELTGTGCGWCPRGLIGMEKLRQTFGDRFIGIGIHQFNSSDAMYIADYRDLGFQGAPSCRIDRGAEIDPYEGSAGDILDDFRQEMQEPAMVDVSVSGIVNAAMTEVQVTAQVEPLFDTSDYTVELALVADGLSGTTAAWLQSNYYAQQSASSQPADLRIFCSGGKYGTSSVRSYVFNDVAVGTSFADGRNQAPQPGTMTGGQKHEVSMTLKLPTKATLRNAIKKGTVYAVALVVDKNGRIANAARREVGDGTGISTATATAAATTATAAYTLGGTRLDAPRRGLNIVRHSDGTVSKVIVRK